MTIMNVDDSSTMRRIVTMSLSPAGHQVVEAENGADALAKLKASPADAVVLDINMPVMNGLELLKAMRADPALRKIPVIMLTTQGEEETRTEAIGLGANGFLAKPFQKEELLAVLKKVAGI